MSSATLGIGRGDYSLALVGPSLWAMGGFAPPSPPVASIDRGFLITTGDGGTGFVSNFTTVANPVLPGAWAGNMSVVLGNTLYLFSGTNVYASPLQ